MPLAFSMEVTNWTEMAKRQADAAFKATVLDAVNNVKALTPVDTGFLRANWTVVRNGDPIPLPSRVQNPEAIIARLKVGDRVLIVNPVVYAPRIEFGFVGTDSLGRHYDQQGRGMMQQTILALPEIARKAIDRVMAGAVT